MDFLHRTSTALAAPHSPKAMWSKPTSPNKTIVCRSICSLGVLVLLCGMLRAGGSVAEDDYDDEKEVEDDGWDDEPIFTEVCVVGLSGDDGTT